jgi:hypothetical protein
VLVWLQLLVRARRAAAVRISRISTPLAWKRSLTVSLITSEKRLAARAREQNVEILTTAELLAEFGFVTAPPSMNR